jgi:hypothetical protein
MNRHVFWGISLAVLLGAHGCSDNGDSGNTPVTPGDPQDPGFEAFMEQFAGIDEITGDMIAKTFMAVEDIMNSRATGGRNQAEAGEFSLVYHSDTQFWVARLEEFDPDEEITFTFVDSSS